MIRLAYCLADEADRALAEQSTDSHDRLELMRAKLARYKRAVQWLAEHSVIQGSNGTPHIECLDASGQYRQWVPVPADLRDIILGEQP